MGTYPKTPRRIYSEKLLGHSNPDCTIPKCGATMRSTGWIEHHEGALAGWYLEFECPEHGLQLTAGGRWQALIDAALDEALSG
jgi:hypothetical protein